jgi:hypothetical protein
MTDDVHHDHDGTPAAGSSALCRRGSRCTSASASTSRLGAMDCHSRQSSPSLLCLPRSRRPLGTTCLRGRPAELSLPCAALHVRSLAWYGCTATLTTSTVDRPCRDRAEGSAGRIDAGGQPRRGGDTIARTDRSRANRRFCRFCRTGHRTFASGSHRPSERHDEMRQKHVAGSGIATLLTPIPPPRIELSVNCARKGVEGAAGDLEPPAAEGVD